MHQSNKRYPVLLFIIGVFYYAYFQLFGTIRVGEFLLFLVFLMLPLRQVRVFLAAKENRYFLGFLAVNVFLVIISNLVNNSLVSGETLKNIASYSFIITSIVAFYFLLKSSVDDIIYFFAGGSLGGLFFSPYLMDNPVSELHDQYFDILVVPKTLNILLLLSILLYKKKNVITLLMLFYGLAAMYFNARSIGAIFILSSVTYFLVNLSQRKVSLSLLIPFFTGIVVLMVSTYVIIASSGLLGDLSKSQLKQDNKLTSIFLMIGRPDPVVALIAIGDKPWLGHGSDHKGKKYLKIAQVFKLLKGEQINTFDRRFKKIPSHSVLLGSVVEAGVLAALPWIFVLYFFLMLLIRIQDFRSDNLLFFLVFSCFFVFWNILFSPTGFARYDLPYVWGGSLLTYLKHKGYKK